MERFFVRSLKKAKTIKRFFVHFSKGSKDEMIVHPFFDQTMNRVGLEPTPLARPACTWKYLKLAP